MKSSGNHEHREMCFEHVAGSGLPEASEGAVAKPTLMLALSRNTTWRRLCEKCCAVVSPVMQVGIVLPLWDVMYLDNSKEPGAATYLAASAPASLHLCSTAASRETTGSFFLKGYRIRKQKIFEISFFPHSLHCWILRHDLQMFWESLLNFAIMIKSSVAWYKTIYIKYIKRSYIRAFQHWKPLAWMLYWNIYSIFTFDHAE